MGYVGAANRAFILAVPAHRRSLELVYAAPVPDVPLAGEALLVGPGDPFLADHAGDLLGVDQSVDARDALIRSDSCKSLQSLEILVYEDDRRFFCLNRHLLSLQSLDSIHNAIGNDSVENIYKITLIWQRVPCDIRKVERNLTPFLTSFTALPDPLGGELFPVREVLDPFDI